MDINTILKNKFPEVEKAFFEKENNEYFLRIQADIRNLDNISKLSRKISSFLDDENLIDEIYYLDVYSPGTDTVLSPMNANEYIGENVEIELVKHIKDKNVFIGEIVLGDKSSITIRWNAKGQFRKQVISIDNIENIKKYAKLNKRKRVS